MTLQSDTLQRALTALDSICEKPPVPAPPLPRPLLSQPPHDPAGWREPFARWLDITCVRHSRQFSGLLCLSRAFSMWMVERDDVPPTSEVFTRLLLEQDLLIAEVKGTVLVSGLVFKDDLASQRLFQTVTRDE
jgi:hypothetical protein